MPSGFITDLAKYKHEICDAIIENTKLMDQTKALSILEIYDCKNHETTTYQNIIKLFRVRNGGLTARPDTSWLRKNVANLRGKQSAFEKFKEEYNARSKEDLENNRELKDENTFQFT